MKIFTRDFSHFATSVLSNQTLVADWTRRGKCTIILFCNFPCDGVSIWKSVNFEGKFWSEFEFLSINPGKFDFERRKLKNFLNFIFWNRFLISNFPVINYLFEICCTDKLPEKSEFGGFSSIRACLFPPNTIHCDIKSIFFPFCEAEILFMKPFRWRGCCCGNQAVKILHQKLTYELLLIFIVFHA